MGAVLLAALIIFFFVYRASVARGMEVEIVPPPKVLVGVPFEVKVDVSNTSSNSFKNVNLALRLPKEFAFVGQLPSQDTDSRAITGLDQKGSAQQTFTLIALSGENTFKKISASATYNAGSFKSLFAKGAENNIVVGGHGVLVDIATPQKVFSGVPFDAEISFKNVSGADFTDLKLKMVYPLAFNFIKATLNPDIGNNTWVLGDLRKGAETRFKITGILTGPEGAFFDLAATAEALLEGQLYPIYTNAATISIATSPISMKINVNNDNGYIAGQGSNLGYTINYVNNTDVSLRDLIIRAKLDGAMYDLTSLSTSGTFRSSDNSIVWTASNFRPLSALAPGQSGSVTFSIRTKDIYPIKKATDKNFLLKVLATIDSPTVPYFVAEGKTESYANIENKVGGSVDLTAKAYFRDPSAGITNKGSLPLSLNQPTQFTIHWRITNYATDLRDVEVRTFLGGNVAFTGVTRSNAATIPTYNDRTQELIWRLPGIPANYGVLGKPTEAIFQVEALPSTQDVGRDMLLAQESTLTAIDDFTGLEVSDKDSAVTSRLLDEPTGGGSVLQHPAIVTLQQQQKSERDRLLLLLQQQQASQAERDRALQELTDSQYDAQQVLDRQIQKLRDAYKPPVVLPPSMIGGGAGGGDAVADTACAEEAAARRDAENAAVDDNKSDDLRAALDKRRLLLIAAALVGDPHLRHIAIVVALKGYEESEMEIEKEWNEGRANAQRQYQEDLAACNSAGIPIE